MAAVAAGTASVPQPDREAGRPAASSGGGPAPARGVQIGPLSAGVGAVRGAPSELRRQMREKRRLRLGVLVLVSVLMLAALPLYFGIRATARDPVFTALDELAVPAWGTTRTVDDVSGNRWCWIECRLRERTSRSEREPDETNQVYLRALTEAGWRSWRAPMCPEIPVEGHYSCWTRDELTLDLWVRKPTCAAPAATAPPDGRVQPAPGSGSDCAGSQVSLKVRNAVDDIRTKPQPATDPSLTGVDPDPALTDDPLRDLTPRPS